jgi:hypothetical protein
MLFCFGFDQEKLKFNQINFSFPIFSKSNLNVLLMKYFEGKNELFLLSKTQIIKIGVPKGKEIKDLIS